MRARSRLSIFALLLLLTGSAARADQTWNGEWTDPHGVGLGIAAGANIPSNGNIDFKASPNWGFFVDIPLLDSFHITPSTLLYKLRDQNGNGSSATDVSLNFKFNIPLHRLDIFAGITAGITSTVSIDPHVGVLAGVTFRLLPNLGLFAQLNYKYILRDENVGGNISDFQIYAGPMFRF